MLPCGNAVLGALIAGETVKFRGGKQTKPILKMRGLLRKKLHRRATAHRAEYDQTGQRCITSCSAHKNMPSVERKRERKQDRSRPGPRPAFAHATALRARSAQPPDCHPN